jgi:F0F1-type ATP synthase assembly protein I
MPEAAKGPRKGEKQVMAAVIAVLLLAAIAVGVTIGIIRR